MSIKRLSLKASLFLITFTLLFSGCVTPEPADELPGVPVPSGEVVPRFDCPGRADEILEIADGYKGSVDPDSPCWDKLIYSFNTKSGASLASDGAMRSMGSDPACLLKLDTGYIPTAVSFIEIILSGAHQGYFEVDRDEKYFEVFLPKLTGKKELQFVYSDNQGERYGSLIRYTIDFGE